MVGEEQTQILERKIKELIDEILSWIRPERRNEFDLRIMLDYEGRCKIAHKKAELEGREVTRADYLEEFVITDIRELFPDLEDWILLEKDQ